LLRFFRVLDRCLDFFAECVTILMCGTILFGVASRYIFRFSTYGLDEIVRFSLIWMTFLGAVLATRDRKEIAIDVLSSHLPLIGKRIVKGISDLLTLFLLVFLAGYGWKMTVFQHTILTSDLQLPGSVMYIVVPGSAILMGLYLFVRRIRERAPKEV